MTHGFLATPARPGAGLWNRIPLVIRAILVGLLVAEVGIVVWGVLLATAPPPIALVATPALLVLYWLFSNLLTIGQQLVMNRIVKEDGPAPPGKGAKALKQARA